MRSGCSGNSRPTLSLDSAASLLTMKKVLAVLGILIVLVLAGLIAAVAYIRSGAAIGIDKEHPLGQLEKVETYLVTLGLEKNESALNSIRKLFGGSKVLYYAQSVPEGSDAEPDGITVVADTEGVIQEVTCIFRRDPSENKAFHSKVKVIAKFYWEAAGGSAPDFRSADPEDEITKEFVKGRVRGTWTRSAESERVSLKSR